MKDKNTREKLTINKSTLKDLRELEVRTGVRAGCSYNYTCGKGSSDPPPGCDAGTSKVAYM